MKNKTLIATSFVAFAVSSLHGQDNEVDPFRDPGAPPAEVAEEDVMIETPTNISICYETFSLPLAMAAKIQREQLPDSKLYARILAAVEKEEARQESFTVLRARSGQKSKTESISEQIYATEYEPPEMPSTVGVSIIPAEVEDAATPVPDTEKLKNAADSESFAGLKTPATPTAFQTRNVGNTLEIEPTLDEDNKILDLIVAPEHVTLVGQSTNGQGESKTEMPIFETQSIRTNAQVLVGQPFLIGTVNRPPNSKVDPDSATRVWFSFVTATLAKP
jgi:Bacterial type II and III secretion system protein